MTAVKLLIRNLVVSCTGETSDNSSREYPLVYLEGRNISGNLGIGAVLVECDILRFDREKAGFTYVDSLCLEKQGVTYRVSYILR